MPPPPQSYRVRGILNNTRGLSSPCAAPSAKQETLRVEKTSIITSNPNPSYAKKGDTITVSFSTTTKLTKTPTVTIAEQPVPAAVSGTNYTATLTITNTTPEGTLTYDINTLTNSTQTINPQPTQTTITIDRTPPTLSADPRTPTPQQDGTFHFWSDEEGAVSSTCILTQPYTATSSVNTIQFTPFTPGTHTCTITVTDKAGNVGTLTTQEFNVAQTKPVNTSDATLTINKAGLASTHHSNSTRDTTPQIYIQVTYNTPPLDISDQNINPISLTLGGPCKNPVKIIETDSLKKVFLKDSNGKYVRVGNEYTLKSAHKTIIFTPQNNLPAGIYNDCTVTVVDGQGITSNTETIESFTVDPTFPNDPTGQQCLIDHDGTIISPPKNLTVCEVESVKSPTAPDQIHYQIYSTKGGSPVCEKCACNTHRHHGIIDNNKKDSVHFKPLLNGTHTACKVSIRHDDGTISNTLTVPPFTVDDVPPVLRMISFDTTPSDPSPTLSFSSNESGTLDYGGDCIANHFIAKEGKNTITFIEFPDGTYNDCTISVTDHYNNTSQPLTIPSFTIATTTNTQPDAGETVLILVHEDVYDDLQTHLAIYAKDIKREHGLLSDVRKIAEYQTILDTLEITRSMYQQGNLNGVLLIGDVPTGFSLIASTDYDTGRKSVQEIIIDDGIYLDYQQLCEQMDENDLIERKIDLHKYARAKWSSEIFFKNLYEPYKKGGGCYSTNDTRFLYWVARLSPNARRYISDASRLQHYFERNHAYRTSTQLPKDHPQYNILPDGKISFNQRILEYIPHTFYSGLREKIVRENIGCFETPHECVKKAYCNKTVHSLSMKNACLTDDLSDEFVFTDLFFDNKVPFLPELAKRYEFVAYAGHGTDQSQEGGIQVKILEDLNPPSSFFLASFSSCGIASFAGAMGYLVGSYLFGGKYGGGGMLVEAAPNTMFSENRYGFNLYYPLRSGVPVYRTLLTVAPVWRKQTNIYGDPTLSMRYQNKSYINDSVEVSLQEETKQEKIVTVHNKGTESVSFHTIINKVYQPRKREGYIMKIHSGPSEKNVRFTHTVLGPGKEYTFKVLKGGNAAEGGKIFIHFPFSENRELKVIDL